MAEDSDAALLDMAGRYRLVEVLIERGYHVVGPTLRDNAIVLAELESAGDLPRGWGVDVFYDCLVAGFDEVLALAN